MSRTLSVSKTEHPEHGVTQLEFSVDVAGVAVPCVLWKPSTQEPETLIAMGHGGAQHKKTREISSRAMRYASEFGWAGLAIDAPGHGDRITRQEAAAERVRAEARLRGDPAAESLSADEKIRFLDGLAKQAVAEWRVALDTTLERFAPEVGSIGYWGVSQGTWIGVPLVAQEQRIRCAVLGLSHLHPRHTAFRLAAECITVPIRFVFQWDDPIRVREFGIALFDAFGSSNKSMHIYPGGHTEIPVHEGALWDEFFQRYLE